MFRIHELADQLVHFLVELVVAPLVDLLHPQAEVRGSNRRHHLLLLLLLFGLVVDFRRVRMVEEAGLWCSY